MLAVIRIRGTVGVNPRIKRTLDSLGLKKINSIAIVKESPSVLGMLKRAKDYVTWGEITEEMLERVKDKKALKPPKGGFKSIKRYYPKGDLGNRGDKINDLIKRMI